MHTTGAGTGTIRVKWTLGSRVLGEPEKQVKYTDAAATEFHLQSADGFPAGDYNVEVFFNGQSSPPARSTSPGRAARRVNRDGRQLATSSAVTLLVSEDEWKVSAAGAGHPRAHP